MGWICLVFHRVLSTCFRLNCPKLLRSLLGCPRSSLRLLTVLLTFSPRNVALGTWFLSSVRYDFGVAYIDGRSYWCVYMLLSACGLFALLNSCVRCWLRMVLSVWHCSLSPRGWIEKCLLITFSCGCCNLHYIRLHLFICWMTCMVVDNIEVRLWALWSNSVCMAKGHVRGHKQNKSASITWSLT